MHEIRNDLGLPYPKIINANYRVKLDSINKHEINLKAKELLLQETEAVTSSEQLYAVQLMYWILEEHPILSSDDMLSAVLILLRDTEPKAAMEWLFKEQIPEMQLEMQQFQEEEEPTIAAVILLKRLAHKLQATEFSPSSELLLPEIEYPPDEVLAMLGVTSPQSPPESPEQHLTPLGESMALPSIIPTDIFSEQKFKPKKGKVGHHSEDQVKTSNSATDYYNRGLAKHRLGQYEAAIADYDNTIRLEPDHLNTYYDRGLAKKKLGQTSGAEQDWRIALKLAKQTGNVYLKNRLENVLHQSVSSQVKLNFKSKREKVIQHSENQVKEIVVDYFKSLPTASAGYSIKREYPIQMGSDRRRADIVFLRNRKLVAIAECKRTGRVESGNEQLHSYLCATDTFLGIFANDGDPNKWIFWENYRRNNFLEIDRETFENYIYNHDKAIKDREKKIKEEIQREIDAEIRERVRKNTDTNAIRQNETDRIKQEVIENIDKTAIANSVRSQIAQQAKNGLLNKRDEENLKFGRSQGFWWTILSIIGIGILIALLTSAA